MKRPVLWPDVPCAHAPSAYRCDIHSLETPIQTGVAWDEAEIRLYAID